MTFGNHYLGVLVRPRTAFRELLKERRMLPFSFAAVSITALLYTFVYVFLIFGGGQPFKPWLNISLDDYYRYNVFFCAPSMFLGWILAAGVVQLSSRFLGGIGSFEQTLAVLGFGISIASWSTGIHDLLTSFLGGIHVISQRNYELALNSPTVWRTLLWVQMVLYLIWFIVLFSKGTKTVQGLSNFRSILIGTIGFVVYQMFFFIFNR